MPTTVTVSMFYIGNFADMDTDETDQDNEDPNVVLGLYDSLVFVDVSEVDSDDDGVILDDEFVTTDFLRYDTGAGSVDVALDSSSLYNADILLGDGSTISVPVLVIQAANGDVFVSEFPANPLDGLAIQSIDLVSLNDSDASGINQGASDMQGTTIVCYAAGMRVTTPDGEKCVEDIRPGDLLMTLDHGPQPVRWVHSNDVTLDRGAGCARPIMIAGHALGRNRPACDLVVSPQHRVLVGGRDQLDQHFRGEAFVPAKSLTGLPGVRKMNGKRQVRWVHFACDRHEVVFVNGCLTETLLLGPAVLGGLTFRDRQQLADIFGTSDFQDGPLNGPPARKCLTVSAVRQRLRSAHTARAKTDGMDHEILA